MSGIVRKRTIKIYQAPDIGLNIIAVNEALLMALFDGKIQLENVPRLISIG